MRKLTFLIGVALLLVLAFQARWFSAAEDQHVCGGTPYEGAWFTVQIPAGMTVTTARPSSTGEGFDSIWAQSKDSDTEFYLYAPQWGGTPYDIFLGSLARQEESVGHGHTDLELTYENSIGRFEIIHSSDPVSHRTIGFRSQTGQLSDEERLKFECFKKSIDQFSD